MPISAPLIEKQERDLVTRAINSGWISSRGPYVDEFERAFASFIGAREGIATTSGTTALHLALATLGVGPDDEVLLPDFTMIACANSVLYTGARPVFVDVDPTTWTMDPQDLAEKISPRARVVMPVHVYGHPADMDSILEVAEANDLIVVEDAAEAHGATHRGRPVGGMGDMGCFSFYANKIITTGEGGMVVTNSGDLADRARRLRDLAFSSPERDFRHREVGFNYRMTNIQAAIGLAQLSRIESFINHRRESAKVYDEILRDVPGLTLPQEASWARSVYWMYTVLVSEGLASRRVVMKQLGDRGVESRATFWPLHLQPFLRAGKTPGRDVSFPVSTALGRRGLSLPSGNGIGIESIEFAAETLKDVCILHK